MALVAVACGMRTARPRRIRAPRGTEVFLFVGAVLVAAAVTFSPSPDRAIPDRVCATQMFRERSSVVWRY